MFYYRFIYIYHSLNGYTPTRWEWWSSFAHPETESSTGHSVEKSGATSLWRWHLEIWQILIPSHWIPWFFVCVFLLVSITSIWRLGKNHPFLVFVAECFLVASFKALLKKGHWYHHAAQLLMVLISTASLGVYVCTSPLPLVQSHLLVKPHDLDHTILVRLLANWYGFYGVIGRVRCWI